MPRFSSLKTKLVNQRTVAVMLIVLLMLASICPLFSVPIMPLADSSNSGFSAPSYPYDYTVYSTSTLADSLPGESRLFISYFITLKTFAKYLPLAWQNVETSNIQAQTAGSEPDSAPVPRPAINSFYLLVDIPPPFAVV
jgi:hypothetical protein